MESWLKTCPLCSCAFGEAVSLKPSGHELHSYKSTSYPVRIDGAILTVQAKEAETKPKHQLHGSCASIARLQQGSSERLCSSIMTHNGHGAYKVDWKLGLRMSSPSNRYKQKSELLPTRYIATGSVPARNNGSLYQLYCAANEQSHHHLLHHHEHLVLLFI